MWTLSTESVTPYMQKMNDVCMSADQLPEVQQGASNYEELCLVFEDIKSFSSKDSPHVYDLCYDCNPPVRKVLLR